MEADGEADKSGPVSQLPGGKISDIRDLDSKEARACFPGAAVGADMLRRACVNTLKVEVEVVRTREHRAALSVT